MKTLKSIFSVALVATALASCEDVPLPYEIAPEEEVPETSIYYSSAAHNTGWSTQAVGEKGNPWSQGSSYTQATGYQKWDGADSKSNREAEGFLVSPKFNTVAESGKVKFSVEYCVGYANNDKDYKSHIAIYVSKTYEDGTINLSEGWEKLNWQATFTSTDWSLTTEEIQLPDEYVNQPNVHLAYWFYAPASGSATFEVKQFVIEEGVAGEQGGNEGGNQEEKPGGDTNENAKGTGTAADPFNVAGVIAYTQKLGSDVNSTEEVYFTGTIESFKNNEEPGNSFGNATFYVKDESSTETFCCYRVLGKDGKKFTEGAEAPAVGDKVTVRGLVVNYMGNTPETVSGKAYVEKIEKGQGGSNEGGSNTGTTDEKGDSETNGNFETWTSGKAAHWTTASTAGNATLKQSTDAHGGKYAIEVGGATSANKRLGYEEMTLEAGTYTMTFWTKAATATGGSVRPGFVPVDAEGKVGSYVYGAYTNDLTTGTWVQVTHTFEIPTTGTYCLVIMNSKTPGANVLIDDFVLMKGETVIIK